MKRLVWSLFLITSISAFAQVKTEYYPPTNIRNASNYLPGHVDLMWSPPTDWTPSIVNGWIDYDRGIYGDNAIGSCPGCPVEVAIRWDSNYFSDYYAVYLKKIRFVLTEPALDYALKVYQRHEDQFDTLFSYPLQTNLVYNQFDTLEFSPITIDKSKELWIVLWVSDLGPGYPLAVGKHPVVDGYGNMIRLLYTGIWQTLMDLNPDLSYPWNIGAYIETPYQIIHYPVFNVYRSIDDNPFVKIHDGDIYDTIYHDDIYDPVNYVIKYYVSSRYQNGTTVSSDTLQIWTVNILEKNYNNELVVYPNPASDRVTIRSTSHALKYISLINSNGEIVMNEKAGTDKTELDLSKLPASIYIIRADSPGGSFTSRLLIIK